MCLHESCRADGYCPPPIPIFHSIEGVHAMNPPRQITIYTDGSCKGNPGPGGWAAVLTGRKSPKCLSGGVPATTNNRMELMAAIEGLKALSRPSEVLIVSDSEYLVMGARDRLGNWKDRNFRNVKNTDLWLRLLEEMEPHLVSWHWTRAHAGDRFNEIADSLAKKQAAMQSRHLEAHA